MSYIDKTLELKKLVREKIKPIDYSILDKMNKAFIIESKSNK